MVKQRNMRRLKCLLLIGGIGLLLLLANCGGERAVSTLQVKATETAMAVSTMAARGTETAVAARVLATLTAEARITPTPSSQPEAVAKQAFEAWAKGRGEPYRDVVVKATESDSFFARVRVIAWFRPRMEAPWEEREAETECRRVGEEWQCDQAFSFQLTPGERARRAQATATTVARATATAQAQATATASAIAAARATAIANMPALRQLTDLFGIELVYVPAGEFIMGSTAAEVDAAWELCRKADSNCRRQWFETELPQHRTTTGAFWMGKTEITNAQYRPFVEAGGYRERSLWTAAGWAWREKENVTQPACWTDGAWNQPAYPVVCVSWYEALAYARWLARETGLAVRLPTTAEWEKAARGSDGRMWPWGEGAPDGARLNFCDKNCSSAWQDTAVDDRYATTAPVGSYPAGASPYGALDMAGNVWEWTSTRWGGCDWPPGYGYPYRSDDGREGLEGDDCRVVRGGGWYSRLAFARPAQWGWYYPLNWDDGLGLRLVVAPQ